MEIRRNGRHRQSGSSGMSRLIITAFILFGIIFLFWSNLQEFQSNTLEESGLPEYLPDTVAGSIYRKPHFTLSYSESHELTEWVTYRLSEGMLNQPKTSRTQDFEPDPAIQTGSAHYMDYKNSGYRRGHLVPAADMSWNKQAMDATFLMSNVVPMREHFNDGIWLELEHQIRDWARRLGELIIISGPVLEDSLGTIGRNEVFVPRKYYKAVFAIVDDQPQVIGFLFDQTDPSPGMLEDYIIPIDSLERLISLDLFANLYGDWDIEIEMESRESSIDPVWSINERWTEERMKEQN